MKVIPFKINIRNYDELDFRFTIEYIPEDTSLSPIVLNLVINPDEVKTEEQALAMIKSLCPQDYWRQLLKSREVDHSTFKNLKGRNEDVPVETFSELVGSTPDRILDPALMDADVNNQLAQLEEAKLYAKVHAVLLDISEVTV